jgi:hypothetical protein
MFIGKHLEYMKVKNCVNDVLKESMCYGKQQEDE